MYIGDKELLNNPVMNHRILKAGKVLEYFDDKNRWNTHFAVS
jgi:hypothetical protein